MADLLLGSGLVHTTSAAAKVQPDHNKSDSGRKVGSAVHRLIQAQVVLANRFQHSIHIVDFKCDERLGPFGLPRNIYLW